MAPLSILIVGAGIAGPTLATFLLLSSQPAQDKPHITIVERSAQPRTQGQNIDIRGAGVTIIRKLGLEATIRASLTNEAGARFVDSSNRVWAEFPVDKSGKVQTGTSDIEILRGRLADILYRRSLTVSDEVERAGGKGLEYIFGDYVDSLVQKRGDKVDVRFAKSGEERSFDVVVGADGLQSRTRQMAFGEAGEEQRVKRLGLYGGFFSMPKSAADSLWRRWYTAPGRKGVMIRPSDRWQKDRVTVFMSVLNDEDQRLRDAASDGRKGTETQKALLAEYFDGAGWECPRVIREMHASDDFYYDMIAQIKMDKWSKGRVVLLGDAGYCGSPISGMGTTLGLSGAYNLAGALTQHPSDPGAAFEEYERLMRPTVELAQALPLGGYAPYIFHLETLWGNYVKLIIFSMVYWSGLATLIAKFGGPPADKVKVEEFGFRRLPEWKGYADVFG